MVSTDESATGGSDPAAPVPDSANPDGGAPHTVLGEPAPERVAKRDGWVAAGIDPYPVGTALPDREFIAAVLSGRDPDSDPSETVTIAGRVMSRRDFGGLVFMDLKDGSGRCQVCLQKKVLSPERFKFLGEHLDLGDLLAVRGPFQRTKKGQETVFATDVELVCKALKGLPKEYFGLADVEARLRHRYVDLAVNAESFDRFALRSELVRGLRRSLEELGFMEVETPLLHPIAGGATARPFVTHHNTYDVDLYLRIAPELYLKRLLVGGYERVFEIGRNFRNEGISPRHNPEFTMLEAYWAYARGPDWMDATERMVAELVRTLGAGTRESDDAPTTLRRDERVIDFGLPFARCRFADLIEEHAGADVFDRASVEAAARRSGVEVEGRSFEKLVDDLFDATVQEHLVAPTFVTHYPVAMSPLSKVCPEDGRVAERFELFIDRMEVANGFSELNDPAEQLRRFEAQVAEKDPELPGEVDRDYVEALCYGMPPAAGIGIGVDRLAMLLTDADTIRDLILFPLLRPNPNAS